MVIVIVMMVRIMMTMTMMIARCVNQVILSGKLS